MLPLTNQKIKPRNRDNRSVAIYVGKCITLYGLISTLLLPLTIVICGQYGEVLDPGHQNIPVDLDLTLLSLTDISVSHEVVLISLISLVHLLAYICVIKEFVGFLIFNVFWRGIETLMSIVWLINVMNNNVKSYVMSQLALEWLCVFSVVNGIVSTLSLMMVTVVFKAAKMD